LTAEIDRIRGVLRGASPTSQAASLANFATLTAQTRAGDTEAGKLLASASQQYLEIVKENSGSLLEFQRASGFILSSLQDTRALIGQGPSTSATPLAAYSGPTYTPPVFTPPSNDALISEVRLLREQVKRLEDNTKKTADALEDAQSGNAPLQVETV
jgi:hypothetical protein